MRGQAARKAVGKHPTSQLFSSGLLCVYYAISECVGNAPNGLMAGNNQGVEV
jgi:hypothetical protein